MALEDLLSAMRSEANEEIARLERESRSEEAEILRRADEQASALEEELLGQAEAELERELRRRRSRAQLDSLAASREVRERAFAKLVEQTQSRLAELREGDRYDAVLTALLRESQAALPAARVLRIDPRDEALARELAGDAGLEIRAELDTTGGLELETDDGRVLRNTLEARLAAAQPRLRLLYGRLLTKLGEPARDGRATPNGSGP
jgi:V/A-type H+/Na+-transporting ATPase subunit E